MNLSRQTRNLFAAALVASFSLSFSPAAPTNAHVWRTQKLFSAPTNLIPQQTQWRSPVDFFRQLLAMSPAERGQFLTNKPPEIRAKILAKVREYQMLDPDERELRLRATELRWYLMPLLREPTTNSVAQLERVPEDLRPLVEARLRQWDILPPPMKQEFLDNERALRYFTHVDATNDAPEHHHRHAPSDDEQARWSALPGNEQQRIAAQFNQFFDLTPEEKQKTLNTLSAAERAQMEKTLLTFGKLPPMQRVRCIRAFAEFAKMSPADRADFLKNAQRWSQLSPKERQTWRDLVAQVPEWPPLPSALIPPPLPPRMPPRPHLLVATNSQ